MKVTIIIIISPGAGSVVSSRKSCIEWYPNQSLPMRRNQCLCMSLASQAPREQDLDFNIFDSQRKSQECQLMFNCHIGSRESSVAFKSGGENSGSAIATCVCSKLDPETHDESVSIRVPGIVPRPTKVKLAAAQCMGLPLYFTRCSHPLLHCSTFCGVVFSCHRRVQLLALSKVNMLIKMYTNSDDKAYRKQGKYG